VKNVNSESVRIVSLTIAENTEKAASNVHSAALAISSGVEFVFDEFYSLINYTPHPKTFWKNSKKSMKALLS
jgi:hypothetical protein